MSPHRGVTKIPARFALALGLTAGAAALGCVPTANKADLPSGAASLPCYGQSCVPNMTGAPVTEAPQVYCDPAEAGLEFFPFDILNNDGGTSTYFYQYVDGTAGIWPSGYGPPAIQQQICKDAGRPSGNYVMHESGGLFTGWGGGIGVGLAHFNSMDVAYCSKGGPVCPAAGGYTTSTQCYCPPAGTAPGALGSAISSAALDVSQWDGISFWARRGPNGQPLMRVLVGDKFTDDDISYLTYVGDKTQQRLCERKIECSCLFQDATCDWYSKDDPVYGDQVKGLNPSLTFPDPYLPASIGNGGYFCGAPGSHPGSASSGGTAANVTISNICGRTLCDYVYAAYPGNGPDPQAIGRACTPYTYRSGSPANICYNPPGTVDGSGNPVPADPVPAESDEQCGDHFTFPVHLTTDWQFFTIPFAQMFQQGWAKQAPYFDLTSASVVRFTWDTGYVDYYIDDVRFYRVKANGSATTPPP
jgi:hypothetical protein